MAKKLILGISFGLVLFLMCAGTMTGIWNQCGTIPAMTRLGLILIRPEWFLPLAFILCFCFSLTIGTSFGTVGTLGVVFISIGTSLGLPIMTCANTIIWGSFSGFVFSPLSDCMNMGLPAYLPVILVFGLMVKKLPSIMALIIGSLAGLGVAVGYQGQSLQTAIQSMWTGAVPASGNTWFDAMFTRGGVYSMLSTLLPSWGWIRRHWHGGMHLYFWYWQ